MLNGYQLKKLVVLLGLGLSLFMAGCQQQTAEDHIAAANAFIAQNDKKAAVVELKNAIQLNPTSADARFQLGQLYLSSNAYDAAEKEFSRALELGYESAAVIPMLSRAYQKTGANAAIIDLDHNNEALSAVERIEIGFYKVQSLAQLNKTADAQVLIEQLVLIDTDSVYKGLVKTMGTVLAADYPTALSQAIVLQQQAPLNKDVLSLTARLYLLNEQASEAANVYSEYVKAAPEDIETRFALANLLVEQKRTQEAEPHVDKLLEINDQNGLLNQLKGVIRAAENDFENAQKFSEVAIKNGQSTPVVRLVAGYAAFEQGKYEDAERHLSQIVSLLPNNHPGLRILAASQLQTGKADEATSVLGRLDNLSAQDATLFSQAGYELLQQGNINAANTLINKADTISESTDDLTRLGVLKLSVNNIEGVLDLEKAVSKAPKSVTANTTLATAYLATNQLEKAEDLAKSWQASDPTNIDAILLEGNVAQRNGDNTKALAAFDKANKLAPDNARAKLAIAGISIVQQDFEKASKQLDAIVAQHPSFVQGLFAYYGVYKQLGNTEKAIQPIKLAQAQEGAQPQLSVLLARIYANEKQLDAASKVINTIAPAKEAPAGYWPLKGAILLQSNQLQSANEHYDAWLSIFPAQRNAVLGKLLILDGQNKTKEALALTQSYLAERDDVQISIVQAYLYASLGDLANAKALLDSFERNIQPLPFVRGIAARVALLENRPQDAVTDALIAYNASANSKNMLLVVQAYESSKQSDASYEFVKQHVAAQPNDLRALMIVGEKQITKDVQGAISTYKQALGLNANNYIVLNNLAYILMLEGDLEQASRYAKTAYELKPDSIPTVDTYAQILIKQDRVDEAVQAYQKVRATDTDSEEIYLNYVEALLLNDSAVIAKRRLDDKTFELKASLERVADLTKQYNL